MRRQVGAAAFDAFDLHAFEDVDAVGTHPAAHEVDQFGIDRLAPERRQLEQGHARAQPAICLRQLAADRTAADHNQMARGAIEIEDRLDWSGKERHHARPGIGGTAADEPVATTKLPGLNPDVVDLDLAQAR